MEKVVQVLPAGKHEIAWWSVSYSYVILTIYGNVVTSPISLHSVLSFFLSPLTAIILTQSLVLLVSSVNYLEAS